MNTTTEKAQIWVTRSSTAYWRVSFDNPPLNVMGPQFVRSFEKSSQTLRVTRRSRSWFWKVPFKDFFSITLISSPISKI